MKQLLSTTLYEGKDLSSGSEVDIPNVLPLTGSVVAAGSAKKALFVMYATQLTVGNTITIRLYAKASTTKLQKLYEFDVVVGSTGTIYLFNEVVWAGVPDGAGIGLALTMQSDLLSAESADIDLSIGLFEMLVTDTNGRVDVGTILGAAPLSESSIATAVKAGIQDDEDVTTPTALGTTFKEKMLQVWASLFGRVKRNGDTLEYYDESNTLIFTRTISSDKVLSGYEDVAAAVNE